MQRSLCGVPDNECSGGNFPVNKGMHVKRTHESPQQAFKCHKRWLLKQGYEQIGSREFRPPDGSETLVLTKQSKFGGKVRKGKTGEQGDAGKRCAFMKGGGTIIVV